MPFTPTENYISGGKDVYSAKKERWHEGCGFERMKISWPKEQALLEVIERKRVTDRILYKPIADRHKVRCDYLRRIYHLWTLDWIQLSPTQTAAEVKLDTTEQRRLRLSYVNRYEAMMLRSFERGILRAEDLMTEGDHLAWKTVGIPDIVKNLKDIAIMRAALEKDHGKALSEIVAAQERMDRIMPAPEVNHQLRVIAADEHQRALEALDAQAREAVDAEKENGTPDSPVPENASIDVSE